MKHGMQKQIAGKAGISGAYLSQIVNGHRRPSWLTAKKISVITNTTPELWLEGSTEEIQKQTKNISIILKEDDNRVE